MVAADAAVITGACFAAWLFRRLVIHHAWWPLSWENYPKDALVLYTVPVTLLALRAFGLYLPRRDRTLINELAQVVKACALAMLGVLAILYVFDSSIFELTRTQPELIWTVGRHTVDAGRVQLAALGLLLPAALSLHRLISRAVLRHFRRRGWNLRHVCIIGSGRLGQIVARTLERNPWTGIKVSYFISHVEHSKHTELNGKPVRGGLSQLEELLTEHKPDAVYVALPARQGAHLPDVLARLEKFPVDVRIVPDVSPRYVPQNMSVNELDGMPILSYRESPTTGLGGVSKRALDIAGALAAIVLFSPVMLVVAALVRLSGQGPVIFRQRRVSLGGQIFDIYKFRTMHHAGDEASSLRARPARRTTRHGASAAHPEWTTPDDPRVTRLGRFLRKTSLDELPQLFNVLVGDMSLVGPRPERPELIERFKEDWRGYMMRQHVKAGMTGWAQINGHRGNSSLRKRLQYDLFYVKNWSIAFDLKILWLTLFRGFVHKNAH